MKNIIRQLTFICIVGVTDELREDVEKDIEECQQAGVVVRMVTSQNRECARIAAEKCRILKRNSEDFGDSNLNIINIG
jgi:P-type E1-E2 ATPase